MAAWPSGIRKASRNGWRGSAPNGVRVTAMDAGPAKRRRDSTRTPALETFAFKWSDADLATFDAFYRAQQASEFDFTHPKWGAVTACFVGAPDYSESGRWNLVSVQLEIYR